MLAYHGEMDLSSLSPEDRRSWHLNAAAIAHARADWSRAKAVITLNLDRMERRQTVSPTYIARCRELVSLDIDEMAAVFLALTDEGQVLRSVHPWAGLLPNDERLKILAATRRPLGAARHRCRPNEPEWMRGAGLTAVQEDGG